VNWEIKKLSDVCSFDKNQGLHTNLPYVGLENIESNSGRLVSSSEELLEVKSSTFKFTEEHLLYGRLRPYLNKVYLPDFVGHCSTEIFPIKPKKIITREFLRYWFIQQKTVNEINATCTGARMPRANMSAVLDFLIPVPSISTQQKIVTKLDAIFAEIDKATAAVEANTKNAEVLFQSYLIQIFNAGNTKFMSVPIGEIGEVISGSGFPVNEQGLINEEVPFYKVSDMNMAGNQTYMVSHNNSISKETAKRLGAKIIPSKSVIFPKIGGAIATNKKRILSIPSCVDNNVMGICPNQKIVSPEFFFHLFSAIELSSLANEAALPSIKKSTVEERLVNIPKSLNEQNNLVQKIDSLKNNTSLLNLGYLRKLSELNVLKNSILSQAYSGELVKE
jgi:type I restriction enzyme, S subunit